MQSKIMNKNDKMIDDLIAQLDKQISHGVGHVNIRVENQSILLEKVDKSDENLVKEVEVLGCLDCMGSNMACAAPTLMKGLDDQSAEEGE